MRTEIGFVSLGTSPSAGRDFGAMTVTAQPLQLLHETYAFYLRTEVLHVIAGHHPTRLQLPGRLRTAMTWANATRHAAIGMSLVGGRRICAKGRKQRRPHTSRISWTGAPSWAW